MENACFSLEYRSLKTIVMGYYMYLELTIYFSTGLPIKGDIECQGGGAL